MFFTQCKQCQRIGRSCRCEMCDSVRDPNAMCPWCQRAFLFLLPSGRYQCDHCSYQATVERHQDNLAALQVRQEAMAQAKAQREAYGSANRDILACYQETTKRRSPGGNDATGTSKEDKLSGTSLAAIKMQAKYSEGVLSRKTELLDPKDKILRVTGCSNPGAPVVRRAIDRLFGELAQWAVADTYGVGKCEALAQLAKG